MNCHFCGKSLGIAAAAAGDSDFCSSEHRKKFHTRLTKGLHLIADDSQAPKLAGPLTTFVPVDSLPRPALFVGPICRLRLPAPSLAVAADVRPGPEVKASPLAVVAGPAGKADRLADLGSRLRGLRSQLDRASGAPRQLATA